MCEHIFAIKCKCLNVLLLSGIQAFVLDLKLEQWEVHRPVPVCSNPACC